MTELKSEIHLDPGSSRPPVATGMTGHEDSDDEPAEERSSSCSSDPEGLFDLEDAFRRLSTDSLSKVQLV